MCLYNYLIIGGYTRIEDILDISRVHRTYSPIRFITNLQVFPCSLPFIRRGRGRKKIYIDIEEKYFYCDELEFPYFYTETKPKLYVHPDLVLGNGREEYYINSPIRRVKIEKKNQKYLLLPNKEKEKENENDNIYIIAEVFGKTKIEGAEIILKDRYYNNFIIFIKNRSHINLYYETKEIKKVWVKDKEWCGDK
jgi:hypothetical protein